MFSLLVLSPLLAHLMAVVVPDAIVALISAGVTFLLVQGAKEVLRIFHVDLSGMVAGVAAILVALIVAFLNGLLGQIPAAFQPLADELLRLLVLLLGALGPFAFYRAYREFRDR